MTPNQGHNVATVVFNNRIIDTFSVISLFLVDFSILKNLEVNSDHE